MDTLIVQLLIGLAAVLTLSGGFYLGAKALATWAVIRRPVARWRRLLDQCPDIPAAARNTR